MVSVKDVNWRAFVIEGLFAFFAALAFSLALFRAPSPFLHVVVAGVLIISFIICRRHVLAFGNPLVTISMVALRKMHWYLGLALVAVQLCMGTVAGLLMSSMVDNIATRMDGLATYATFSWSGATAEALGAFLLVAAIMSILNDRRGDSDGSQVAFSLFIITYISLIVSAIMGSLGILNPATAFALRLHASWTYVVAPIVGGVLGGLFYSIVVNNQTFRSIYGRKNT